MENGNHFIHHFITNIPSDQIWECVIFLKCETKKMLIASEYYQAKA